MKKDLKYESCYMFFFFYELFKVVQLLTLKYLPSAEFCYLNAPQVKHHYTPPTAEASFLISYLSDNRYTVLKMQTPPTERAAFSC